MTQDYTRLLGYDPYAGTDPYTKEQWATDFALTYANAWANGTIQDTQLYQSGGMSNDFWSAAGLGPLNQNDRGSGIPSNASAASFYQLGLWMADNYNAVPAGVRTGMPNPSGLPNQQAMLSNTDRGLIAQATGQIRAAEIGAASDAAANASREAIAAMQESGANTRAQLAADTQRYSTDVGAAVDREAIASNERVSAADRASREGIANADRRESARQFDLGLGEDRRQFNTTILMGLLDRGIELSRRPVDWIAHQFFLQNMDIPVTAISLTSAAATFGAIPPTGPSAAGPVIGGPAALDGDTQLASALGTSARLVSVSEATQVNPGGGFADAQPYNSQATVQRAGGAQVVDGALEQARMTELPSALPESMTVREYAQRARMAGGSTDGLQGYSFDGQRYQLTNPPPAAPPAPAPQPMGTFGAPPPAPPAPAQTTSTGGNNAGVYTGVPATPPAAAASQPAAQTPQGTDLLAQIARELGVPLEQVQQLVPPQLLAGGYSKETIMNTPAIQSLITGQRLSAFRTAPVDGSKFGEIQAFGIPLGVRGGQDVSARNFLTSLPSQQEQTQGALEATGQYWPDVQQQMLRSSAVSNYDSGAFGRRRF